MAGRWRKPEKTGGELRLNLKTLTEPLVDNVYSRLYRFRLGVSKCYSKKPL